ncbi:MAG: type II secretion system inner membrane protein GspF [Pseudomonadota bacterium]|nr:type II secretion system inner membrane protein GspF [Pseudomonadota bacterium]
MSAWSYKALTPDGKVSKGILEGESERQVRAALRQRQLKPLEVLPARSIGKLLGTDVRGFSRQRIGAAELALFTRQLATLLIAGVPLIDALGATARQTPAPQLKSLLLHVRAKVLAGHSLAASLGDFPDAFSELYRAMVRAGEHAGLLGKVLDELAGHIERRHELQQKVQMALLYPCTLLVVALGVIALLMGLVMPDLVALFQRTGAELPLLTRILIGASIFIATWWWLLLALIVAIAFGMRALLRDEGWRLRRDALLLRLPLVGRLLTASDTARFAATLSILTTSGVALVDALAIAASVMGNRVLRQRTEANIVAVQEGGSLAQALEACGFFPPLLTQMVASGESSGTLDTLLQRAATAQERELELTLNALTKVLEPVIIVTMAIVVGAIVMAVLLPIMQMNTLVA